MTQEEKDLLLKDLCSRLPYGVKIDIPDLFISTKNNIEVLNEIFCGDDGEFRCNNSGMLIKSYLFPLLRICDNEELRKEFDGLIELELKVISDEITPTQATEFEVDFYNKHHLDWRGLIPMGLAIDATGLNIY